MTAHAATTLPEQLIGGPIGNWLAIVGVISLLYWAWRIVMALQNRHATAEPVGPGSPAVAPTVPITTQDDDDIVVVAAAAYAVTFGRRVVRLAPASPGQSWGSEGRWAQQNSHLPR